MSGELFGVLLCVGPASGFAPGVSARWLLPVGGRPAVHSALAVLRACGAEDAVVIIGDDGAAEVMRFIGTGAAHGLRAAFAHVDEAAGEASGLLVAEGRVGRGRVAVIIGDTVLSDASEAGTAARAYAGQPHGAMVLLAHEGMERRPVQPAFGSDGRIAAVVEAGDDPLLGFAGVYLLDGRAWGIIRQLGPGAASLPDVVAVYASAGDLTHRELSCWRGDASSPAALLRASALAMRDAP